MNTRPSTSDSRPKYSSTMRPDRELWASRYTENKSQQTNLSGCLDVSESSVPLPKDPVQRIEKARRVYNETEEAIEREIKKLRKEEHKLYHNQLHQLWMKISSYPSFDQYDPHAPAPSSNTREILESYTFEQASRFLAMSEVWTLREKKEAKIRAIFKEAAPPSVTVLSDTVTPLGHFALYQIVEKLHSPGLNPLWSLWSCSACHEPLEAINNGSAMVTQASDAQQPYYIGDILMVFEMRIDADRVQIKACKRLARNSKLNEKYIGLNSEQVVVPGCPRVIPLVSMANRIHVADIFIPEHWPRQKCAGWTGPRASLLDDENILPPIFSNIKPLEDTHVLNQEFHDFTTGGKNPWNIEYFLRFASSAHRAMERGRFDDSRWKPMELSVKGDVCRFVIQCDREKWPPGVRVQIVAGNRVWIAQLKKTHFEPDVTNNFVARLDSKDCSDLLKTPLRRIEISQIPTRTGPILEEGFWEELAPNSNGKLILKALYDEGGDEENKWAELQPEPKWAEFAPNCSLDSYQTRYLRSVLSHAPVTIGNFPMSSGKTSTIALTALNLALGDLKSMNLILVPTLKDLNCMEQKMEEILDFTDSEDVGITVLTLTEHLEQSNVEEILDTFIRKIQHREIQVSVEIQGHALDPTSKPLDYWLRLLFVEAPPTIVIFDCSALPMVYDLELSNQVKSIQIDDVDEFPEIELAILAAKFENTIFGFIGDRPTVPKEPQSMQTNFTRAMTDGDFFEKLEKIRIDSNMVYKRDPMMAKIWSKFYQRDLKFAARNFSSLAPNPDRIELIEHPGDIMDAVAQARRGLKIGILCSTKLQVSDMDHLKPRFPNLIIGLFGDFEDRKVDMLIFCTTDGWAPSEKGFRCLLRTARKGLLVNGCKPAMDNFELWRRILD